MKKVFTFGFSLLMFFASTSVFAQTAVENRSATWPSGDFDMYARILGNTAGTLFILFLVFGFLFYLFHGRGQKSKRFLIVYSSLFAGFLSLIYYDTVAGVSEFIRLCETKAGFYGKPFPKGEGVLISENLVSGCRAICGGVLRGSERVGFVQGRAFESKLATRLKKNLYEPGFYKVQVGEGNSETCAGLIKYPKIELIEGKYLEKDDTFCFILKPIKITAATLKIENDYQNFKKSGNIGGFLEILTEIKTNKIHSSVGEFTYHLGLIALFDIPNLYVSDFTIARCKDYNAHNQMFGKYQSINN